jgi:hypothetical protein
VARTLLDLIRELYPDPWLSDEHRWNRFQLWVADGMEQLEHALAVEAERQRRADERSWVRPTEIEPEPDREG